MAHLLREASFRHSPHPLEEKVIRVDVLVQYILIKTLTFVGDNTETFQDTPTQTGGAPKF